MLKGHMLSERSAKVTLLREACYPYSSLTQEHSIASILPFTIAS